MPDQDQENELFARICQKDQKAFEQLYRTHYRRLLILAFQYVKSKEMAEEIVNDVLMKIWKEAPRLNIAHSLRPYLSRSVVNRSLNVIRQQNRLTVKLEQYQAGSIKTDESEDQAAVLEDQLLKLEQALEGLPPQCKKILMMSKFEKCKQKEIAERLNVSIKTVKNQLTIGYEKIRKAIGSPVTISIIFLIATLILGLFYQTPVL
jgi:RNA polymerase sigma-70 factor (family 1)